MRERSHAHTVGTLDDDLVSVEFCILKYGQRHPASVMLDRRSVGSE